MAAALYGAGRAYIQLTIYLFSCLTILSGFFAAPVIASTAHSASGARSDAIRNARNAVQPTRIVHALNGKASFYRLRGRTSSGEELQDNALTAAHRTLPFNTRVRVKCTTTGKSVVVRINDRGPFVSGRVVDVSYAAAKVLGLEGRGIASVMLEVLTNQ